MESRWKFFIFIVYIGILLLPKSGSNSISEAEISALHDIYTLNNGPHWTWRRPYYTFGEVWNFSQVPLNPCAWQGVACVNITANKLAVVTLALQNYSLNGILPPSIYNLSSLWYLELDLNKMHGTIPDGICNLHNLTIITMTENSLSGSLPSCFFLSLPKVEIVALAANKLNGPIPLFPNISPYYLVILALENNQLTGTIPPSIVYATLLIELYLGVNYLHGPIDDLSELKILTRLSLNTNLFDGTIPVSFGNLTTLQYLYLHVNQFHGSLPDTFSNLTGLIYFTTYANLFTGSLPTGFQDFINMQTFIIDDNYHTGTLPYFVGQWPNLQQLAVYDNYFGGLLPSSLSQLPKLTLLLVQENLFTGTPGMAFNRTAQKSLQIVDIASNEFTGAMPIEIFGESLLAFSSFETCFSGEIPSEICQSKKLESLSLDGMRSKCAYAIWGDIPSSPKYASPVKGTIPECMWSDFRNLTMFHASSNALTGTIPSLTNYGNLSDLDLSFNSLRGTIPFALQSWTKLMNFDLQNNKFSGDISGLQYLHYAYSSEATGVAISLSNNRLSGIIPWALQSAENMDVVDGNLFSCSEKHQPPYKDKNSNNYVCGSNLLDISLFTFLSVGGIVTIFVVFVLVSIQSRLLWKFSFHRDCLVSFVQNVFRNCHVTIILLRNHQVLSQYLQTLRRELDTSKATTVSEKTDNENDKIVATKTVDYSWSFLEIKFHIFLMLWWRSKLNHFLLNQHQEKQTYPNLYQFLISMRILRVVSVLLMLMVVAITLPLFGTLKFYYGTYKIQYRWALSGAFLSGYEPSIAIIGLWFVLLISVLLLIHIYIPMRLEQQIANKFSSFPSSSTLASDYVKRLNTSDGSRNESTDTTEENDIRGSIFTIEGVSDRIHRATVLTRSSFAVKSVTTAVKYVQKRSVWVSMLALVGNIIVVLVLKASIITLLVASDTSFGIKILLEVCLSGVDLMYGAVIVPFIINRLPHDSSTGRMILKTVMLFMNSIIAPCLVIAFADASCFEGALVSANSVNEEFTFTSCILYSDDDKDICEKTTSWQSIRPYTPTFLYNFTCYSTILIEYIPIFMMSYSFLTLAIPFVSMLVLYRKQPYFFMALFPGVYFVEPPEKKEKNPPLSPIVMDNYNALHKLSSLQAKSSSRSPLQIKETNSIDVESELSSQENNRGGNSTDSAAAVMSTSYEVDTFSLSHRPALFPAFILASTMHHLLVLLTFGAMCPGLSVAIALVNVTTSLTWETLIGRWLMRDDPISPTSKDFVDVDFSSHTPYFGKYTQQFDRLCTGVCCSPRKCFGLLIFGSGIFFAFGTLDIAGDKQGWKRALWAPLLIMVLCIVTYFTFDHNFEKMQTYCLPKQAVPENQSTDTNNHENTPNEFNLPDSSKTNYVHNRSGMNHQHNNPSTSQQPKKQVLLTSIDEEISF